MPLRFKIIALVLLAVLGAPGSNPLQADALDDIGLTALLIENNTLTGDGIVVGMAEASASSDSVLFQFNPVNTAWNSGGVPVWFFQSGTDKTYLSNPMAPDANRQYNSAQDSGHAAGVAGNYASVAPGVDKVEVFHADYFIDDLLSARTDSIWTPVEVDSRIISQSYIIKDNDNQAAINAQYGMLFDAYANEYGTFFVNGVNNQAENVSYAPGAMYNGITVGNKDGANSLGVHLVAPDGTSSNATPMVAGAAAVLLQAAEQSFASDAAAADNRVLKALLINGANKTAIPAWGTGVILSNGLDQRYGAGMLNVYDSYKMLTAGRLASGTTATNPMTQTSGWDMHTLALGASNSYFFEVSPDSMAPDTITATLTWNSITSELVYDDVVDVFVGTNQISDFSLSLWRLDGDDEIEVAVIDSADSNVEHLYLTGLLAGVYELRVTLDGTPVSITSDTYALAFNLVPEPSTSMLICLGGLYALALRRRRLK